MKIEPSIQNRIIRNILLSIFIYALPVALMLLTFYITGERPWEINHKTVTEQSTQKK